MAKRLSTLDLTADLVMTCITLEKRPWQEVKDCLRLLNKSNPRAVHWLLYTLADIYEEVYEEENAK